MEPTRVLAWLAITTVEDRLASNVTTPAQHVALEGQPIALLVHLTRSGTFLRTLADVSQDIMTLELSFVPSVCTLVRPVQFGQPIVLHATQHYSGQVHLAQIHVLAITVTTTTVQLKLVRLALRHVKRVMDHRRQTAPVVGQQTIVF